LSDINVGGRELGQAAMLLCQFWPAQFGEFPVKDAKSIAELMDKGIDIWEKIRELAKGRPGGTPFCWKKTQLRERLRSMLLDNHLSFNKADMAVMSECDMTIGGKCYGECPAGSKPMSLVGSFAPVCTTECSKSTHTVTCGFGCSNSTWTCFRTVLDQVSQVTKTIGMVGSFLTGNPLINEVVDKVLWFVEFAIDTLFKVVKIAKDIWGQWPKEDAELATIIALLQFILDSAKELGQTFDHLQGAFSETLGLVLELMDAEFEWVNIDLKFVADTVLKHGAQILDAAYEFSQVFIYPTCKMA
jgi:hypothetical protein